jgi:hypothetical protein
MLMYKWENTSSRGGVLQGWEWVAASLGTVRVGEDFKGRLHVAIQLQ